MVDRELVLKRVWAYWDHHPHMSLGEVLSDIAERVGGLYPNEMSDEDMCRVINDFLSTNEDNG